MNLKKKKEQEERLNKLVLDWYNLEEEKNFARKTALWQQIFLAGFEYLDWLNTAELEQTGDPINNRHDRDGGYLENAGLTVFEYALTHYDPSKGEFSHYYNRIMAKRKFDRCRDVMGNEGALMYLEQKCGEEAKLEDRIADSTDMDDKMEVYDRMRELMAMIINFAERHSSRENNESGRRWYRIFYTEDMTYALKEFQVELRFAHERDIFAAMDCRYLDYYMTRICRNLKDITDTELKKYNELVENGENKDTPLPLPADVSIYFLKKCEGIQASRTGRSNYFGRYKKEKEQLGK